MGECHYQVGNYDAIVTAQFSRKILEHSGIHPERLALHWASAAEAPLYVELITRFTRKIEDLGPLGSWSGLTPAELERRLAAARGAATDVKLRTRFTKLALQIRQESDYSEELLNLKIAAQLEPVLKQTLAQKEAAPA